MPPHPDRVRRNYDSPTPRPWPWRCLRCGKDIDDLNPNVAGNGFFGCRVCLHTLWDVEAVLDVTNRDDADGRRYAGV